MKTEDYLLKAKALKDEYDKAKRLLGREYAFSNNKYKIGDIVKDHQYSIRIEEIKWTDSNYYNPFPHCVYYGTVLKKDNTPTKKPQRGEVRFPIE